MPKRQQALRAILTDPRSWLKKTGSSTTVFSEIAAESARESSGALLDQEAIRREEDWNDLANQVVGRETSR